VISLYVYKNVCASNSTKILMSHVMQYTTQLAKFASARYIFLKYFYNAPYLWTFYRNFVETHFKRTIIPLSENISTHYAICRIISGLAVQLYWIMFEKLRKLALKSCKFGDGFWRFTNKLLTGRNHIFHSSIAGDCSLLHDPIFIQVSLGIAHLIICTTLFSFKYRWGSLIW
jgi:hypothetical protein